MGNDPETETRRETGASLAAAGLFTGLWMHMDVAHEPKLSGNEFLSCWRNGVGVFLGGGKLAIWIPELKGSGI